MPGDPSWRKQTVATVEKRWLTTESKQVRQGNPKRKWRRGPKIEKQEPRLRLQGGNCVTAETHRGFDGGPGRKGRRPQV